MQPSGGTGPVSYTHLTALVCLHDPALALDSCDILVVLQGGGVAAVLHPRTDPPAVLQGVSFSVPVPGQLIGLLGVNGSGKTTLLKAAAGLLPHTGQCLLDGVPLESLSTRRLAQTVSYIPQQSGISVSLSAREVVLMGFNPRLGVLQSPTAAMRAAADEALRTVGLANKAGQDYLTLSGGEKQLCILARTIAEDAPLLLLDEPDSALDLANRSRMTALLAQLCLLYTSRCV